MSKRTDQQRQPSLIHLFALTALLVGPAAHGADAGQPPLSDSVVRPSLEKAIRDALPVPFNARFDLRDVGRAAPSGPDSPCASCWASAATYVLESKLTAAEGAFVDLSEAHMQRSQAGACHLGASAQAASAYLTAWRGPIAEDDYLAFGDKPPYKVAVRAHIDEVVWLPMRQGPLDNTLIKQAIRQHGPVYASVSWRGIGNQANQAYYWPGNSAAHAVALIGWDDLFDRSKFTYTVQGTTYTPPGHGAFIARNNDGSIYFISYYDGTVGYNPVVVFEATLGTGVDRLYQHDPYGTHTLITPSDIPGNLDDYVPKIIGANVFTADEHEQLVAVGFFQYPYPGRKEVFRLSVHLNPIGGLASVPFSPGNEVAQVTVESELGGYHSVALPHPVRVKAGQRFAVLLTGHDVSPQQNSAPLWVEREPFTDPFEAAPGESYISRDGVTWFDLTAVSHTGKETYKYGNLSIKAYADRGSPMPKVESHWDPSNGVLELSNVTASPLDLQVSVRRAPGGGDAITQVSPRNGSLRLGAGERAAVAIPDIDGIDPAAIQLQIGYQSRLGKLIALNEWRPIGELKIAPLRVETTSPLPGATVPYSNPEITARFSRDIKLGPGAGQVILQSLGSTLPTQVAVQGPWLQIYPQGSLESPSLGDRVWTVIIPADAVADSLGTSLTEAYSWSFFVIGVN